MNSWRCLVDSFLHSHLCERSVQSHDLPTGVEFLNIHCAGADDFGGVGVFRVLDGPNEQPLWRVAKSHDHLNLPKIAARDREYKQPEKSNADFRVEYRKLGILFFSQRKGL
jgi:hypothetical protein